MAGVQYHLWHMAAPRFLNHCCPKQGLCLAENEFHCPPASWGLGRQQLPRPWRTNLATSTICELSTSRSCCLGCGTKMQTLDWPRKARNALGRGLGCSQVGLASRNSEPQTLPTGQNVQGNPGPESEVTAEPAPAKISAQTTLSGITEEIIISL